MDPELEQPSPVEARAAEGPSPWLPLGPAHLLFWAVLAWPLVANLVMAAVLRLPGPGARVFSWAFSAVFWGLGGSAILLGCRGWLAENPGTLRRAAFMAAIAVWLLQVALGLVLRFHHSGFGDAWYAYLRVEPLVTPFFAAVPMVLMLVSREEQSGGSFDAAIAALAMLGGLGFLGPFLLAFGALIGGHPLLPVAWDALRRPGDALTGEWFDGGDEARMGRSLGQMALAFALSVPFLALLMIAAGWFGRGGFGATTQWLRPFAAWLTALLLGLASLRVMRRSGHREGRGLAIAALAIFGFELLPLLLGAVLLVLWSAHIIR